MSEQDLAVQTLFGCQGISCLGVQTVWWSADIKCPGVLTVSRRCLDSIRKVLWCPDSMQKVFAQYAGSQTINGRCLGVQIVYGRCLEKVSGPVWKVYRYPDSVLKVSGQCPVGVKTVSRECLQRSLVFLIPTPV